MTGETLLTLAGGASLLAWLVLTFGHGRFWLGDQRLGGDPPAPESWPAVTAVIPARDEADVIAQTLGAVLSQDYPGPFRVVLVDDESSDGTADAARGAARALGREECLEVLRSKPRPAGWVGKVWALYTGIEHVKGAWPETDFLWLSDADVAPAERTLRRLVAKACAERLDLVSLMVTLHCKSGWERLLVPAFVYFFQKLYPFPRVNDPRSRTAGAAGGCVVVRSEALARAGGIEAIRGEIIDDCALGQRIKQGGRVWLGLGTEEHGVRPYAGIGEIWDMVARSAYTQLGHSPLLLLGTLVGLLLVYAAPPALLLTWPLHASAPAALLGGAAWLAMAVTFLPTLVLYGRTPLLAAALPVAGTLYAGMTLDSALRHHRGEGARWKGRVGAGRAIVLALVASSLGATSPAFADPPKLESWLRNTDGATGYAGIAADVQAVQYTDDHVWVSATGIPSYPIGPWPMNPNVASDQAHVFRFSRNPTEQTGTKTPTPLGPIGAFTNGVSIYNSLDAISFMNKGVWFQNAVVLEAPSFDSCLGHAPENGDYHHHQNPICLYTANPAEHSPIVGFAFDGVPLYGAYGYANADGSGGTRRMESSYRTRSITMRNSLPDGTLLPPDQWGPPVGPNIPSQPLGNYVQDFEHVPGLGDLDEYNGRFAVTPDYPSGVYAYYATIDSNGSSAYPYTVGPEYWGVFTVQLPVDPAAETYTGPSAEVPALPSGTGRLALALSLLGLAALGMRSTRKRKFLRGETR